MAVDTPHVNSVELTGHFGGDLTHALSAWTSTSRNLTEEKRHRIPAMLKMLAANGHHTPFEKSYLQFIVICDTATHIHFLKHRIGVSVNAESARYKELKEDKFYVPVDWPHEMQKTYIDICENLYKEYHGAVDMLTQLGTDRKRAKESSRLVLPYANQLSLDVAFNFRSFMHFQSLRNKPDAQLEVRTIAAQMIELVRETGEFDSSLDAFGYLN